MRKLVVPASPTASIPDPERGDCLPAEGRVVDWTPHWALMALRNEITVAEPEADGSHGSPEPAAPAEPAASHESAEAGHGA